MTKENHFKDAPLLNYLLMNGLMTGSTLNSNTMKYAGEFASFSCRPVVICFVRDSVSTGLHHGGKPASTHYVAKMAGFYLLIPCQIYPKTALGVTKSQRMIL